MRGTRTQSWSNDEPSYIARRRRACVRAALLLALALPPLPAFAQMEIKDLNELPLQRRLDPMNRLLPTDPHVVIRAYLRDALPLLWWGRETASGFGSVTVEIHVPDNWRGNPTSAMMRLCPAVNNNLWRVFREIELRPFYGKKFWPSWTCRG